MQKKFSSVAVQKIAVHAFMRDGHDRRDYFQAAALP
jgi:hypothetical protein